MAKKGINLLNEKKIWEKDFVGRIVHGNSGITIILGTKILSKNLIVQRD